MKTMHIMGWRVNDTTIHHINIYTATGDSKEYAISLAKRKLEKIYNSVNELVTYSSKTVED